VHSVGSARVVLSRLNRSRPAWRCVALAAVASIGVGVPRRVCAQEVLLQLRPHTGDTLHMRLDQEMDITRTGQAAPGDGGTEVTRTWVVLQRMIVERVDTSGTEILQVTDSVSTGSVGGRAPSAPSPGIRPVDGSQVLLHVAPDGAVTLADTAARVSSTLRELLANLPVTFPRDPVKVGNKWVRAMKVPTGPGYSDEEEIKLEFRLDSVSPDAATAYVSVHGPLGGTHVKSTVGGARVTTKGTVAGSMAIDRRRGWLTDWHANIDVQYALDPPRGSDVPPSRVHMTATQWLRTIDRP